MIKGGYSDLQSDKKHYFSLAGESRVDSFAFATKESVI